MTWELKFPYRDRDDRIDPADVAAMSRELEHEDAQVARSLALLAVMDGCKTYGDLLDHLEAAGRAGRRRILDRARESAGLLPTEQQEQRKAFEAANGVPGAKGPMRLTLDPGTGLIVDSAWREREGEKARRSAESRARRHEHQRAAREAEADVMKRSEKRRREAFRAAMPEGLRS